MVMLQYSDESATEWPKVSSLSGTLRALRFAMSNSHQKEKGNDSKGKKEV